MKVPVAVNCLLAPSGIDGIAGVIAIVLRAAGLTASVVELEIVPDAAVIVVVPMAMLIASPVALIVATLVSDDVHVADALRSCVLPSVYVPTATYCCEVPRGMDVAIGVTSMDTSVAGPTVSVVCPTTVPAVALMVVVPVASALATPFALIVATAGVEEDHAADEVRS